MQRRIIVPSLIAINIIVFIIFIFLYTSATYPMVGGDYSLFGPRLIDSLLHYKINGLSIQWYTPSFGGGLPAYPNPLQMQFSLQMLFTFFTNPYLAILCSSAIYIIIGFLVTFLFIRDVLEFKPLSAILGASFFVANGFFIERVVVGHVNNMTFPLIIVPIFAIFYRKIPAWLAGVLISFIGAILVHSGGAYIGVMALFTTLITFPILYLIKPSLFNIKKIIPVIIWGTVLTLLLCGSKLNAVAAFMQTFPREVHDHYFVNWLSSIVGLIFQLVGVMNTLPFLNLIGKSSLVLVVRLQQWTGSQYGFWEVDSSISPALMILFLVGAWRLFSHKPNLHKNNIIKRSIAWICLIGSIILVVQFCTARGFLYDLIKGLPVLKSLRNNTRFVASFILPLSILGIKIFESWTNGRSTRKMIAGFAFLNAISLISLWSYYLLPMSVQERYFDDRSVLRTYALVQAGNTFPVNKIIPDMNDYEVFKAQASDVYRHNDSLLGKNSFHPLVHEGSVFDIEDGYYNMTDPTGYVFPKDNNSKLFSRIPVADYSKLVDFLDRRQPDWKLPLIQVILDWTAGITILFELAAILVYLFGNRIRVIRSLRFMPHLWQTRP
jgi:hypothetical protein